MVYFDGIFMVYYRRKFRSQTSDNMDRWKAEMAPEGRKVGSLKRRVRSKLARWEMNNCTPLWREAYFQVETYKTPGSDHFWELRCRKSARRFMGSIHWKGFQSSKMRSLAQHLVFVCFCWGTELNNNSWILAISRTKHEAHIDGPYQQT